MASPLAPPAIETEPFVYGNFLGIDRSRHPAVMDTGEDQYLWVVNNAFCDWQGNVTRMGGLAPRYLTTDPNNPSSPLIEHVAFYSPGSVAWAQRDGARITLSSDNGIKAQDVFDGSVQPTSTLFNRRLIVAAFNHGMQIFDGTKWEPHPSESDGLPAFIETVSTRLVMAGMPGARTEIWFSRADDHTILPADETEAEVRVTRAGKIDVANVFGRAEEIRGLSRLENDRLAVFGEDQVLIYKITSDITQWGLEDRTAIQAGAISHNAIVSTGREIIFAARDGIYTVSRSARNGITINSAPISPRIATLYRALVQRMENPQKISACYDRDTQQYHLFFPLTESVGHCITTTIPPTDDTPFKFSTWDYLAPRCGASVGGRTVFGTGSGLFDLGWWNDATPGAFTPPLYVETPYLWCGSTTSEKSSVSFSLQARGSGRLFVEAEDDMGRPLQSYSFKLDANEADDTFPDAPLFHQFNRKFEHRFRGLKLKFTAEGDGLCQINAFAINVRKPGK